MLAFGEDSDNGGPADLEQRRYTMASVQYSRSETKKS